MSKILVIESYQMLRHAFAVALAPENSVTVIERIPAPEALTECELVIIDAAALRERNALGWQELNSIRSWRLPTIWIDTDAAQTPSLKTTISLSWPLEKAALRKAVAECLGKANGAIASAPKKDAAPPAPSKTKPQQAKKSQSTVDGGKPLIELVDVVE